MLVHLRFSIDLSDWLLEAALGEYSDRPPLDAVSGLEVAYNCANAVAHIARCRTSHIHRIVRSGRKASPWDVTGLDDANAQMRLRVQAQALAVRRITASSDNL
jgi:hypothetical protein